jgi:hypothetical protein
LDELFERRILGSNAEAMMKWKYSVGVAWEETEASQNAPLLTDSLTQMPACIAGGHNKNNKPRTPFSTPGSQPH